MSAPVALTVVKGGMTRLRSKGAALKDSLYLLKNGYVTAQKTVVGRPGTARRNSLNTGTKGLVSFQGLLHVFAAATVVVPTGYRLHILAHPEGPDNNGNPIPLKQIHFAAPIMGALYVAAEFLPVTGFNPTSGYIFHYWIQQGAVWSADTVYHLGDIVRPTVENGLVYQATRLSNPNPQWAPNVARDIGDVVEPTTYNDFYYVVIEAEGDNPVSGPTEPTWPTLEGARVYEDSTGAYDGLLTPTQQPNPDFTVDSTTQDRYVRGIRVS